MAGLGAAMRHTPGLVLRLLIGAPLFFGGVVLTLTVMDARASHEDDGVVHSCVGIYTGDVRFVPEGVAPNCTANEVQVDLLTTDFEVDLSPIEERLDAVETKNTEQDGRLNAAETKNTEQDQQIEALQDKDTEQDDRLDDIEDILDNLDELTLPECMSEERTGTSSSAAATSTSATGPAPLTSPTRSAT